MKASLLDGNRGLIDDDHDEDRANKESEWVDEFIDLLERK
jgi:hypothetical protein